MSDGRGEGGTPARGGAGTTGRNRIAGAPRWALIALACYAVLLVCFRPATPFEWDEVLAQRGVLRYDVATHSPQPPGFPAFIAAAKAVNLVVHNPLTALQLVVIASALAAIAGTWALARRLGAPPAVAAGAAAVLAASPEFLFTATVGISDVPGTAAGVFSALALVAAADNPTLLPLAGAVCGVAMGIRPQIIAVYLPALVWAIARGARARRWTNLALGAAAGLAVTAAFWVPAILVTGPRRWWLATTGQMHYMATVERLRHLPGAKPLDLLAFWFLKSFVNWQFAVPLWLLVIGGALALVRRGQTKATALAGSALGVYMIGAFFTMNETVSLRYMLTVTPFVAILAAGGLAAARSGVRRVVGTLVTVWCLTAVAWTSPALRQRLKPEPVWAALTWVREHFDPARTRIVYDGVITPHVQYVLERHGFKGESLERAKLFGQQDKPGAVTLFVTPRPVPGAELLFQARHSTTRVVELAWGRYGSCVVSRMRTSQEAVYSPQWQRREEGWQLRGTGRIHLPLGASPALVRLCAGDGAITVRRPGAAERTLTANQCVLEPLLPGEAGAISVRAPTASATLVPPVHLLPLTALQPKEGLASAYMVPQVAHVPGYGGALWRTDLVVINPQRHPLRIAAAFLPTGKENRAADYVSDTLPAGGILDVPDVLSLSPWRAQGNLGALLVFGRDPAGPCRGQNCAFLVLARTYNSDAAPGAWRSAEWLPGVSAEHALRGGDRATFGDVSGGGGIRTSIGMASWSPAPLRVRARVVTRDGEVVSDREITVPAFGHVRLDLAATITNGRVEVQIVGGGAQAMLVPYVSMVDEKSGLPAHLLADNPAEHVEPAGWAPPRPRPEAGE